MRIFATIFLLLFSFPAFAGCDIYGECHDDPVVDRPLDDVKADPGMPPQPQPLPAVKASIRPDKKKPEKPEGSIGSAGDHKELLKKGTIGGTRPDPVCEDKGDETDCH